MRVAVIQMSPNADKAENIAQARGLIEALAAEQKVDLIEARTGDTSASARARHREPAGNLDLPGWLQGA